MLKSRARSLRPNGPRGLNESRQDTVDPTKALGAVLDRLGTLDLQALRHEWASRWRKTAPPIRSADVLFRMMAWRLQCEAVGGVDRELERRLADLDRRLAAGKDLGLPGSNRRLPPGTVISRDWHGTRHQVTVTDEAFLYDGKRYATLSEVARLITGTHWSGPRFFGLESKGDAKVSANKQGQP